MAWLKDFTLIVRSSITTLRQRVEDPERMLHQLILDMDGELVQVRHHVAEAIADEIQLGKRCSRVRQQLDSWQERAESALKRGDEALAKEALERKLNSAKELQGLEKEHQQQKQATATLEQSVRELETKIRQARSRQTLLVARMSRAESATRVRGALDRSPSENAFAEFSRFEERVERAEARSEALERLSDEPANDDVENGFVEEERKEQLEEELNTLKQRVRTIDEEA